MKKLLITAVALFGAVQIFAACGAAQTALSLPYNYGVIPAGHKGKAWVLGNSAAKNYGVSNNSGLCLSSAWLLNDGADGSAAFGITATGVFDWFNSCSVGCAGTSDTVVALVSYENSAGNGGRFKLATFIFDTNYGSFNSALVTNGTAGSVAGSGFACPSGNCVLNEYIVPKPTICSSAACGGGVNYNRLTGTGSVRINFTGPTLAGNFGSVNPGTLVTGYEVYQVNGSAAPANSLLATWGAPVTTLTTATDCGAGTACSKVFAVNSVTTGSGLGAFFAILPIFDNTSIRADFVSAATNRLSSDPLAVDGLPTSVEAYNTKVGNLPGVQLRWTSTNESEIAGYNVLASREGSTFVKVNDRLIATAGAGTYTQNVTRRTLQSKVGASNSYLVKVQVVMRDGSTQDVGPATYSFK